MERAKRHGGVRAAPRGEVSDAPLKNANKLIALLESKMGGRGYETQKAPSMFFTGVDIGTANLVTVVLDESGMPLDGEITPAKVVKEGMVVDYVRAIKMLENQLDKLQNRLNAPIRLSASAVPPGTELGNGRVTRNILEAAGLEVCAIADEPSAASLALGIKNGAVVDVGGGTTGISIVKNGKVLFTADEPTGGFNFDLVIAGGLGISVSEAEKMKRDPAQQQKLYPVVKPVMEKIASIARGALEGFHVEAVYLVGGACEFPGFAKLMEYELKIRTFLPNLPLLVTPLGIAMICRKTFIGQNKPR
ncbi:MAG: ethanolamine utilization protein EutJ [Synergistaceae bacterium]|nr:ethanolamine utilization protein EutJ [Synergistaceae bacterium]